MEIDKMKKEIRRGGFMRKLLKSKFFRVVCCVAFVGVALAGYDNVSTASLQAQEKATEQKSILVDHGDMDDKVL